MGDKKTETKETRTQTPNVPTWGVQSLQDLNTKINALGATDPSSFVAGASPLQTAAWDAAGNLGAWKGSADQAQSILTGLGSATTSKIGAAPTVTGSSLLTNLQDYVSPYTNDVVDTTLANFDKTAGQQSAQLAAAAAKNGAFGGSRYGIAQGEQAASTALNRASTEANLRDQAFKTATSLSDSDAARRQQADITNAANALDVAKTNQATEANDLARQLQAAGLLGNLSSVIGSNARSDIETQDALGQEQRSIDQANRTAPISQAQMLAELLGQNQLGLLTGQTLTGQTNTTESDPMGAIGGILGGLGSAVQGLQQAGGVAGLAGLFSDGRLKRDVKTLGHDAKGRRRVSWRYLWQRPTDRPFVGFIAQELVKTDPHAVAVGPGGFLTVNYGAL